MQAGVDVVVSTNQKDELVLSGNSLEAVSQSAADIQQTCRVRNKDIRKVRVYSALHPGLRAAGGRHTDTAIVPGRSLRVGEGQHSGGVKDERPRILCALWVFRSDKGVKWAFACSVAQRGYTQNGIP